MKLRLVALSAIVLLPLGRTREAAAMGRRSYDNGTTVYETQPVQRGSPANPNAAFSPPRFENDNAPPSPNPRSSSKEPYMPVTLADPDKPAKTAPAAPAEMQAPVHKAAPAAPDNSEPPLPEYPSR